ncbi:MAG: type II toxin-antitoxin system Phd/YefM family antitoxin [Firmicutes bacterium]|nr:type II toxin-antitoxin system Phd/YefM family antitoxin [Bacillota bacterium]
MNTINITTARQILFQLVQDVNKGFNPVNIVNSKGENAVLISESDWHDIEETIFLNSIPGLVDSINKAHKEDRSKCSKYNKEEEW